MQEVALMSVFDGGILMGGNFCPDRTQDLP